MSEKRGIKELTELLEFAEIVKYEVETAKAHAEEQGEKLKITDIFLGLIDDYPEAIDAFAGIHHVPAELLDIDDVEDDVLREKFAALFKSEGFVSIAVGLAHIATGISKLLEDKKS